MDNLFDPNDIFGQMLLPETAEAAQDEIDIFSRYVARLEMAAESARRRLAQLQQLAVAEAV